MKRYRTTNVSFDSLSGTLGLEIKDDWKEDVKEQHRKNKKEAKVFFEKKYGVHNSDSKEKNFLEVGSLSPSIIAFHNKFLNQARDSFVIGAYYPALTAVTTLTERVLNHLIILLRDDYKKTTEYKEVYNKDSFTDWDKMIRILSEWEVLLPEAVKSLKELKKLRHEYAAHFNTETDVRDRELALKSIKLFQDFIRIQFGFLGLQPWFIEGTKGAFFIKKEFEDKPFIKKVYLPNCLLVGPEYKFETIGSRLVLKDKDYPDTEISDVKFVSLLESTRK